MEKKFEVFGGFNWHGNFDILLVVITVNAQSTLVIPFMVHGYFVILLRVLNR